MGPAGATKGFSWTITIPCWQCWTATQPWLALADLSSAGLRLNPFCATRALTPVPSGWGKSGGPIPGVARNAGKSVATAHHGSCRRAGRRGQESSSSPRDTGLRGSASATRPGRIRPVPEAGSHRTMCARRPSRTGVAGLPGGNPPLETAPTAWPCGSVGRRGEWHSGQYRIQTPGIRPLPTPARRGPSRNPAHRPCRAPDPGAPPESQPALVTARLFPRAYRRTDNALPNHSGSCGKGYRGYISYIVAWVTWGIPHVTHVTVQLM